MVASHFGRLEAQRGLSAKWSLCVVGFLAAGWLASERSIPRKNIPRGRNGKLPAQFRALPGDGTVSFPPHSMGERTIDSSRSKGWRNGLHLLLGAGVESTLQKSIGRGEISVVIFGKLVTVMGQTRTVQTEIVISTSKLPPLKRYVLGIPNVSRGLENQQ